MGKKHLVNLWLSACCSAMFLVVYGLPVAQQLSDTPLLLQCDIRMETLLLWWHDPSALIIPVSNNDWLIKGSDGLTDLTVPGLEASRRGIDRIDVHQWALLGIYLPCFLSTLQAAWPPKGVKLLLHYLKPKALSMCCICYQTDCCSWQWCKSLPFGFYPRAWIQHC